MKILLTFTCFLISISGIAQKIIGVTSVRELDQTFHLHIENSEGKKYEGVILSIADSGIIWVEDKIRVLSRGANIVKPVYYTTPIEINHLRIARKNSKSFYITASVIGAILGGAGGYGISEEGSILGPLFGAFVGGSLGLWLAEGSRHIVFSETLSNSEENYKKHFDEIKNYMEGVKSNMVLRSNAY